MKMLGASQAYDQTASKQVIQNSLRCTEESSNGKTCIRFDTNWSNASLGGLLLKQQK